MKLTKPLEIQSIEAVKQEGAISDLAKTSLQHRWVLNASRRGASGKIPREHLSFESSSLYVHKELVSACVKTDLAAVERVVDLLENMFKNPWSKYSELTSLSTGTEGTSEVRSNLLRAKEKESGACKKIY